jgi:hypothetical protein
LPTVLGRTLLNSFRFCNQNVTFFLTPPLFRVTHRRPSPSVWKRTEGFYHCPEANPYKTEGDTNRHELSDKHGHGKLVRDGRAWATYPAVSAMPAFVRIGHSGSVIRHGEHIPRAILDTVPAQLAMTAVKAAAGFCQGLSFTEALVALLKST